MLFLDEGIHVWRSNLAEEFDILIGVELGHFPLRCGFSTLSVWEVNHESEVRD